MSEEVGKEQNRYTQFWESFAHNLDYLETFEENPHLVMGAISNMLQLAAPDVDFEIGKRYDDSFELILIAGGMRENIQPIIELYSASPILENWVITPFRPRQTGSTFEMEGQSFDISDFYYESEFSDDLTHLNIFVNGYDPLQKDLYGTMAFMFLDTVLGEFDVMTRIGAVQVQALPEGAFMKSLSSLAEEVDARYPHDA